MNLAIKTEYLITDQKAKVKPFEDKVADFPEEELGPISAFQNLKQR